MKRIVILILMLLSTSAWAAEITVPAGVSKRIPIDIDTRKAAMIIFDRKPLAVTGNTQPYFGVEYLQDRMMIAAREAGAVANVFVDFGDETVAILELRGVDGSGADLIRLKPEQKPKPPKPSWSHVDFPTNLEFLSGHWNVHKIGDSDSRGGLKATVRYAIEVSDLLLLHLEVQNKRDDVFALSEITVSLIDLGGFKGTTVVAAEKIPSAVHMAAAKLSPGEKTSGTIMIPNFPLAHDQAFLIGFGDAIADGPQLRITL